MDPESLDVSFEGVAVRILEERVLPAQQFFGLAGSPAVLRVTSRSTRGRHALSMGQKPRLQRRMSALREQFRKPQPFASTASRKGRIEFGIPVIEY